LISSSALLEGNFFDFHPLTSNPLNSNFKMSCH
jgi:hypothetical protein